MFGGLQVRRIQNVEYLHSALRDDLRDLRCNFEELSEARKDFLENEFPGLLVDAHFKAETLRSKSKIKRIARILISSLKEGLSVSADYSEEMMRVATALEDVDIEVLKQVVATQAQYLGGKGFLDLNEANTVWKSKPPTIDGMTTAEVSSICLKLESFGLITRVERDKFTFGLETAGLPFGLLSKGLDFVRFAIKEGEG